MQMVLSQFIRAVSSLHLTYPTGHIVIFTSPTRQAIQIAIYLCKEGGVIKRAPRTIGGSERAALIRRFALTFMSVTVRRAVQRQSTTKPPHLRTLSPMKY